MLSQIGQSTYKDEIEILFGSQCHSPTDTHGFTSNWDLHTYIVHNSHICTIYAEIEISLLITVTPQDFVNVKVK